MRPVRRGSAPQPNNFSDYRDAINDLESRLGAYCSYCERRIPTQLAVEHIQPKKLAKYGGLIGRWDNFLLACVNCNSTKGDQDVLLPDVLLPDRDNTFVAFDYAPDGSVRPAVALPGPAAAQALATLALVGLDKPPFQALDANGKLVARDRRAQRRQAWLLACTSRDDVNYDPTNQALRRAAVRCAVATGFFSVWMTVFQADSDMRNRLIDAFEGTRGSGCFDPNANPVQPAPNPDCLPDGSKT